MHEFYGFLDRVIDGDTIDVTLDLDFDIWYKTRLRLYGINTPEVRTKNLKEKELGLQAKNYVKEYLGDHKLYVQTFEKGKFGRYLARVHPVDSDDEVQMSVNDKLLKEGLAKPYFGEGKVSWF